MDAIQPSARESDHRKNDFSPEERAALDAPEVSPELEALVRESDQLMEFVSRLSNLLIGNIADDRVPTSTPHTMEERHAYQGP
jgi:hypothetical protein